MAGGNRKATWQVGQTNVEDGMLHVGECSGMNPSTLLQKPVSLRHLACVDVGSVCLWQAVVTLLEHLSRVSVGTTDTHEQGGCRARTGMGQHVVGAYGC